MVLLTFIRNAPLANERLVVFDSLGFEAERSTDTEAICRLKKTMPHSGISFMRIGKKIHSTDQSD